MQLLKRQQGMSLIEVLAALLIFAVGLVALIRFQSNLWFQEGFVKQQSEAIRIAQKKVEELRSYEVINTTSGYSAYNDIVSGSQTTAGSNNNYSVSWVVNTNTSPDYKNVSVTVAWTDARGASRTATLASIIAKSDPALSASVTQDSSGGF